jgi:hypothetical protein
MRSKSDSKVSLTHRSRSSSTESSLKAPFIPSAPTPWKDARNDSEFGAETTSSYRKENRTPEEQVAHDARKEARRAAKAMTSRSESSLICQPEADGGVSPVPRRRESRRMIGTLPNLFHKTKIGGGRSRKLMDLNGEV